MNDILEDLMERLKDKSDEAISVSNQLLIENLKTSILKNQLNAKENIDIFQMIDVLNATKQLNKTLEKILEEITIEEI